MVTAILKCYDAQANRLWKSKPLEFNSRRYFTAINQAKTIIGAKQIWIKLFDKSTHKSTSFEHKFPPVITLQQVQTRYTGSDGVTTWTYPIRESAYKKLAKFQ